MRERKASIRADLESTRAEFHKLVGSLAPDDWRKPTAHPSWTVADLLFHMTVALRFLPEDVWIIRHVSPTFHPPDWIFHKLNDWFTRWQGGRSTPGSVRQEYDRRHQRVLELLASLADGELDRGAHYPGWDPMLSGWVTLEDLFRYPGRHFKAHAAQIRQRHAG